MCDHNPLTAKFTPMSEHDLAIQRKVAEAQSQMEVKEPAEKKSKLDDGRVYCVDDKERLLALDASRQILVWCKHEETDQIFLLNRHRFDADIRRVAQKFAPEEQNMIHYLSNARCIETNESLIKLLEEEGITQEKRDEGDAITAVFTKWREDAHAGLPGVQHWSHKPPPMTMPWFVVPCECFE